MRKAIFNINFNYYYDNTRKGAKYSLDGKHYFNGGNFVEIAINNGFGYGVKYDTDCIPFDAGSDIEPLHMSVKSSKATLTSIILGHDMKTCLDAYFARVASTSWAWGIIVDDTIHCYIMNAQEFRTFTEQWASYYEDRHNIRFKATSGKMIQWLEERI